MLRFLLEKEFKQFRRNTFLPRLIIMFPLMALSIFPMVANLEVENIYLSVIDHDKSPYSKQLVQEIQASGYFVLTDVSTNYEQAIHSVEQRLADVILEIPPKFERTMVREQAASLMVSANAVNGNKGGLGTAYLLSIINDFSTDVRTEFLRTNGRMQVPNLHILPVFKYNPQLLYKVFMVPAIMVMVLAMICGFLPALNIVSEKERGTIEQMNVTPVKKSTFILAKLIPYWLAGYVVLTIGFLIANFLWRLFPEGSILLIYGFVTIFILSFSGFGLVISNYAVSVQQAMFMMFFFIMTFIFMSGLFTPVDNMPNWAQVISTFSPLKYIIQTLRMVFLKGSTFTDLIPQFIALSCFAIFFNGWAVLSYRKTN